MSGIDMVMALALAGGALGGLIGSGITVLCMALFRQR